MFITETIRYLLNAEPRNKLKSKAKYMKRRILKKDLWKITDSLLEQCYDLLVIYPNADHEAVNSIVEDTFDAYNELLDRANNPDGKDNPKLIKQYYSKLINDAHKIYHELFKRCDEAFKAAAKE